MDDKDTEHLGKLLKNFVALGNQMTEFLGDSEEMKLAQNKLTESGMWLRMAFDIKRYNSAGPETLKMAVVPREQENGRADHPV